MDSDEDGDVGRSWISFKSLKKAADVKEFFQRKPSPSGYGSINSEGMANTVIHASAQFSAVHGKYREERKEESGREVEQCRTLLASLQSQLQSQEAQWKQRFLALEQKIRNNEKRLSRKPPLPEVPGRPFLPLSDRVRSNDHSACLTEIDNLQQTVNRQKKVIEGLETTISTLREKLAEVETTKHRRKHYISSM